MKKETAVHLQDLVLELACVADVLTAIQLAIVNGEILPRITADSVFAVKSHIVRISDDLDHVLTEVRE